MDMHSIELWAKGAACWAAGMTEAAAVLFCGERDTIAAAFRDCEALEAEAHAKMPTWWFEHAAATRHIDTSAGFKVMDKRSK